MFSANSSILAKELRLAAAHGELKKVTQLIEINRVDINAAGSDTERTALHWAAKNNHLSIVKYLLEKGAQLLEDIDEKTAIDLTENKEIQDALVRHFRVISRKQDTLPLSERDKMLYGFYTELEVVTQIMGSATLENLFDIMLIHGLNANSYIHGIPLLILVIQNDEYSIQNGKIDYFIANSSDINITAHPAQIGYYERTALHTLIINRQEQKAIAFINKVYEQEKCINPCIKDSKGWTIFHLCVAHRLHSLFDLFLEKLDWKKAINLTDNNGRTPLHYAYLFGNERIISLADKLNLFTTIKDNAGNYSFDMLKEPESVVKDCLYEFRLNYKKVLENKKTLLQNCLDSRSILALKLNIKIIVPANDNSESHSDDDEYDIKYMCRIM